MRRLSKIRVLAVLAAAIAAPAAAQTSLTGSSLALQSAASTTLSGTGYVGTYLTVPAGGATVKFTLNATASAGTSAAPHMNLAIADTLAGFSVASASATNYTTGNITLPAGTYVIRDERDYANNTSVTRSFTVNNLSVSTVSGSAATFSNTSTDANAIAAANTYIANYRQGTATATLNGPGGIPLLAGTPVTVDLGRNAFNFGGTVSGVSATDPKSMVNVSNPAVGTEAYKFQQFINSHFNMIVPSNAGKWASNESTRDSVTMSYVDTILNYAQSHNMRSRMHNEIWGSQQPSWVSNGSNGLLDQAVNTTLTQAQRDAAKADLRAEITERTQYYVNAARANQYAEVDVYNESYHTGSNNTNPANYWNVYGASGIADIYNEVQQAVAAAHSSAKIYTNEYNVFQWGDAYANWYRDHIESIRNAGGAVTGIGFQYYADPTLTGSNTHSAAKMEKALMGLSTQGLPMSLTEFGLSSALTAAQADSLGPGVMDDSMRVMFGTPLATSFLIWGWWDLVGSTRPPAALLDNSAAGNNTALTAMGARWEQLMSEWDTNLATTVNANGTITFKGFYGDYYLRGQTSGAYDMTLAKGTSDYSVTMAAPPRWSLWNPAASGMWGASGNWTAGGVANSDGQTACFGSAAGPRSVTVDGTRTVGMLAFDSPSAYTLSGGAINLQGFNSANGHLAAIYVRSGSHTINSPLTLLDNTTINVLSAGDTLTVTNLQPSSVNITKSGAGKFAVDAIRAGSLNINGGTVALRTRASGGATSKLNTLTIAAGTKVDLADTALVTHDSIGSWNGSAYTGVAGLLAGGYNSGDWSGATGIVTSMSAATGGNTLTALGVATADETGFAGGTFLGISAASGDTLVMYTYAGDANLDGVINGDDYFQIDSSFPQGQHDWFNGDFNYDGVINGDDYFLIDSNFPSQGPSLAGVPNAAMTAVPEPAAIAIIALSGIFPRRRRS